VQVLGDALDVGLEALDAELAEPVAGVGEQVDRVAEVVDEDRLADVQLEVAARAGDATATSLPKTWTATMIIASHWVGLTLPGMIELPGLVLGQVQLAETRTRSRTEPADVVGDLEVRLAASVLRAPWAKTSASCAARAANLFGAVTKGFP
jgi:hypothetical protein